MWCITRQPTLEGGTRTTGGAREPTRRGGSRMAEEAAGAMTERKQSDRLGRFCTRYHRDGAVGDLTDRYLQRH
jgi:hypothetical protein